MLDICIILLLLNLKYKSKIRRGTCLLGSEDFKKINFLLGYWHSFEQYLNCQKAFQNIEIVPSGGLYEQGIPKRFELEL